MRWVWLSSVCVACQTYPFTYRPDQRVDLTKIHEVVLNNTDTDILFVIDNSISMGEEQANLIANTTLFVEELARSDNSFRVGVISTDVEGGADSGRLRMVRASANALSSAGCAIEPDDSPLPYLERPSPDDPQGTAKRCRLVEDFSRTVAALGTNGSSTEAGLLAARMALDPVANLNPGFLRPEADLAIIFLSDEEDCSYHDYGSLGSDITACYDLVDDMIPVQSFVDFFVDLKGSPEKVRAAAIVGGEIQSTEGDVFVPRGCTLTPTGATTACGCWNINISAGWFCDYLNDFGHTCTSNCNPRCEALPGKRYHDFLLALKAERASQGIPGGTYADSICQQTYGETLLTIARTVVLSHCFSLNLEADTPEGIQLSLKRTQGVDAPVEIIVPRYQASGGGGESCSQCADCPEGAWSLVNDTSVCLECGLQKQTGDVFVLSVINDLRGDFSTGAGSTSNP